MKELIEKIGQKIEEIADQAKTDDEVTEALAQFFLEEIKEAYNKGYAHGSPLDIGNCLEDYLKSKYGI